MWLLRGSSRYPIPRVQSGQHPLGPERNWISGPGYPSFGSIWSTPAGAEGDGISSLHIYPSVQSGQHPLAPKGDRCAVLEAGHVSGKCKLVCGFSGDSDVQSLGFNLVNTRWDPKETGSLALGTHPSVQSGQHPLAPKGMDIQPAYLSLGSIWSTPAGTEGG